ncbi:MAG: hypothetical protein JRI68_12850 [Deltaproteobacteria bacterium]|nr:hypothetical protein [Deltaproteobacteria bacterium]
MIRFDDLVSPVALVILALNGASCGGSSQPPDEVNVVVVPPIQTVASGDEPPPIDPPDKPMSGRAEVVVACEFADGWVSVLPADRYEPSEEFLMQALIGLTEEPKFWHGAGYGRFGDYRAVRCDPRGTSIHVPAGSHYVLVGWANQFSVKREYRDNGYLEQTTLNPGETRHYRITTDRLTHTWLCISCPYLLAYRDGRFEELGQVLVDRYSRRRRGTDVVRARVEVRNGQVRLRIAEREPEITHLDAVVVSNAHRELSPAPGTLAALVRADGQVRELTMGQRLDLVFEAPGTPDGVMDVEIQVTGHYEPVGPLL